MKRSRKIVFFIVFLLIMSFSYASVFGINGQFGDMPVTYIKGVKDIRWGIDIKGGVEATFSPGDGVSATGDQINAAKAIIETRMVSGNITDYEIFADTNNSRIIVRFPWKSGEKEFDPESAIKEISSTALLTFREGGEYQDHTYDANGEAVYKKPKGKTAAAILVEGKDVQSAKAEMQRKSENSNELDHVVRLTFNEEGKQKFADATTRLAGKTISIWMDDIMIMDANVNSAITDGTAMITGKYTAKEAALLADKINAGALPFKLETTNFSTISPTLGEASLNAMLIAGIIAFILVCITMIVFYRLPGLISCIALLGHVALSFAAVSGFFRFMNSFTLTLPGIAGIILSIGMGVDANVITASRIKEEILLGKTIDRSIEVGSKNSFWAIFDGNITVIIVAAILMGIFGPTNILSIIFGASTTGSIYSFGYTLLIGVISNFVMAVAATRIMTRSISRYKFAHNSWLYGGVRHEKP